MATVKSIREKILHIENCSRNLSNLQNCIVNNKKLGDENNCITKAIALIEDEANLNIGIDILCFNVIHQLEKEIRRLENVIDNTIVNEE